MTESDVFATVLGADEEVRSDRSYCYDNAARGEGDRLVVQRTLSGEGFFLDAGGRRLVGPGWAMLFTHRESSGYGFPPEAKSPYRHRYLAVSPAPPLRTVFDSLRHRFGSVVRLPLHSEAVALFDELFDRFRQRSFRDRFHESELFYRLLISLYREQVRGTLRSDPVEFGFHWLRDRFRTPINLKQVADACGVSREHFARAFRARYHESPGGMLRRMRLDFARGLLEATEMSVEDIAVASGFASSNSFCRAYRSRFGASPGSRRDQRSDVV
jgi:AraC-like DNA-binding protein